MIRKSWKRDEIYKALCASPDHPTADMLYARLKERIPNLSLGTIYTNLAAFKREGMAVSVGVVDSKERFDANTSCHAHFICRRCGDVTDLWDIPLPSQPSIDAEIDACQLNYYGLCKSCAARP